MSALSAAFLRDEAAASVKLESTDVVADIKPATIRPIIAADIVKEARPHGRVRHLTRRSASPSLIPEDR